jgi:hypothetical protein
MRRRKSTNPSPATRTPVTEPLQLLFAPNYEVNYQR